EGGQAPPPPRPALLRVTRLDHEPWVRGQSALRERGQVSSPSHHPGAHGQLAGQVSDPTAAELDEVLGGDPAADQVIRSDERVVALVTEAVDRTYGKPWGRRHRA